MRPIVVFEGVHAHDAAAPRGKPRGALSGVTLSFGRGVHAILGAPEDGTYALFEAITGARAVHRGRVTVAGLDPARTSHVRARIGALAPEPRLPAARTVRDAVRLAMRARGESGDRCDGVIDPLGLAPLHNRDPRALSFAEERAIELALALSTPAPLLLALHEPLAEVAIPDPSVVATRLREIAASGGCVIVTTSSPKDASALGDRTIVLHRGLFAREVMNGEGLVVAAPIEIVVWVQRGARELSAALARRIEVTGVAWEDASATSAWPGAAAVRVRGTNAEACALAVTDAIVETGVEIEGIEQRSPGLGEVRSATETLWKMAQMARMARSARPQPSTPPVLSREEGRETGGSATFHGADAAGINASQEPIRGAESTEPSQEIAAPITKDPS